MEGWWWGENQPALSEGNPPANATALSASPPIMSPAGSGSSPACQPPAYSGTSRGIPDPLTHPHCLSLCFVCSWNPWLPTSSLQAALPSGERPCSTWLPPRLGLAAVCLDFIYFWRLWQTWPLPTLPALAGLGPCGHCPSGLALPLPRVQESRLCPIHLVLIPDSHAHGPLLPSSPGPTLLITVSFHLSPSLQPFALTPWTSESSLGPLGSWFQPH